MAGQRTLDCFLHTSPSTSATTTTTDAPSQNGGSDDGSNSAGYEDRTRDGDILSDDESSLDEEPAWKRLRKGNVSHQRKTGMSTAWTKKFQWLHKVRGSGGKVGMICKVCREHGVVPRSGSKIWTTEPCFHVRLDKVKLHAKAKMHRLALLAEADEVTGGIPRAFTDAFSVEIKAAIGCCKCLY